MTATVTPPEGVVKLARIDPGLRLQDYLTALGFYLGCLEGGAIDAIVFVENSGSDLAALRALAARSPRRDKVEFIGFQGLDYPPEYGRAYGEMKLVDHAMVTSRLIGQAPAEAMVWKVTGRYVVRNLRELVRRPDHALLVCHCRNHPLRWADMCVMGWVNGTYRFLLEGCCERLKENLAGSSPEIEFRRVVDSGAEKWPVRRRFPVAPRLEGVRGWDNERYEDNRGKVIVRSVLNRLMPSLWI